MRLTLFKQLVAGNLIVLGFIVFLGCYVVYQLDRLYRVSMEIVEVDNKAVLLCDNLSAYFSSQVMLEKKYLISNDPDYHEKSVEIRSDFEHNMDVLMSLLDPGDMEHAAAALESFRVHNRWVDRYAASAGGGHDLKDLPGLQQNQENRAADVHAELRQVIDEKNRQKSSKMIAISTMIDKVIKLTLAFTIAAIVLGIFISVANTRLITRPVFLLEKKTREISLGQFDQVEPIVGAPKEIEDLARHFNAMCDRLRELDEMKADFISHFSHELKTPVTSIKEASAMLNMQLFKGDPGKEKELSQLILLECDRLIGSIEKILDLSRMEVFQMDYHFVTADITPVVKKAMDRFEPQALNAGIKLKLQAQNPLPHCRMDEQRIEEVMNNLISNALKYTKKQGKIQVTAGLDKIEGNIVLSVADTGCGIDKKNLDKIFEKFQRIDNGHQTLRGTGLGLAISKHIINAHRGDIWAKSEPGSGTQISFTLPVA